MTEKEKFLRREFWMFSWNGSVQRNHTYKKVKETEAERTEKRKKFKEWLLDYCDKKLLPMYENQEICECIHYKNIEKLKEEAGEYKNGKILFDGKYKIGTAQKLLNLYLKYLWCEGILSPKPPHCPVDGTILKYVGWDGEPWTKWESINQYKAAIEKIRNKANGEHIADWELHTYNELK